ncbi:uncharacterized protein CTRU02_213723 [Colletotrichum truncatum]|uniref:Uncharacterized protein n=1 Tax=Colletotrichum truncatum TaxID=5467 RepID=A0ACC3YGK8_COLTU|nr:uncharacterized protein CTRU02_11703 [Colletotrichum truncatum]KAF6785403.1 hypothetical protein CTRU02_11703 [Colletotrichum truncatum]
MKTTTVLALLGAALASAQQTTRSAPFHLKFTSANEGSAETYLSTCHSGAGESGICPESSNAPAHTQYYLNQTAQEFEGKTLGLLTWELPIGNGNPISTSLGLVPQLVSNGAIPIFSPGDRGLWNFGFDEDDKLFLFTRQDDSKAVPETVTYTEEAYYRWHICWTFVGNYYYNALVWVTAGAPSNPTCTPVDVIREFIPSS